MSTALSEGALAEVTTEYATRAAGRRLRQEHPHVRLVSPLRTTTASRGVFAFIITAVLVAGLITMLLVNTTIAENAFKVTDLRAQHREVTRTEATLSQEIATLAAPLTLQRKAEALGLVPIRRTGYISLTNGTIEGRAKPTPGDSSIAKTLASSLSISILEAKRIASLTPEGSAGDPFPELISTANGDPIIGTDADSDPMATAESAQAIASEGETGTQASSSTATPSSQ